MGEYYRIKGTLHYDKPRKLLEVHKRVRDGGLWPPVRFGRDVSTLHIPEDTYRNLNRTLDYLVDLADDGAVVYTTDSHGELRGGWYTADDQGSDNLIEWAAEYGIAYPEYDPAESTHYLMVDGEKIRDLTFSDHENSKNELRFEYESSHTSLLRKAGHWDFEPTSFSEFLGTQIANSEAVAGQLSASSRGRLLEFDD